MPGTRAIDYREIKHQVDQLGADKTLRHLTEALEQKHLHADDFSIRELAEAFLSREWVDNLHPKRGRYQSGALLEADGSAVAYSHFSNITGQIFFSAVHEGYEMEKMPFSDLIPTKPTEILDMEKIPGISEVGDEFSVIGEGSEYPNFGVVEDYHEIAAKEKRGGIVPVTKEAIFGDKTKQLLPRCRNLGAFLKLNKEKRLIDAAIDENAGARSAALGGHRYFWKGTSYASYQSTTPWVNIRASNGLVDETDLEQAWLRLVQITDPYTGEPIIQQATHIIVTPQNVMTAYRILKSIQVAMHAGGYPLTGNPVETVSPSGLPAIGLQGLQVLSSQLLAARAATDTDWWLGSPAKAFAYYSAWDVTTEEAPPNSRESFTRDIVFQFRASEMGVAATEDPRYMVENQA